MTSTVRAFSRTGWTAPCLAGGIALTVYAATMGPTLTYGGDCGDLITASYTLSNSHPTGYPLYLLWGRVFAEIPLGDIATRYNFLSALGGAIAIALVSAVCLRLTSSSRASLVAGLSLTFCYLFWSQAVIAEVYTWTGAFCAALTLLSLIAVETRDARWCAAFFLVSGMAFAHHLAVVAVFIPLTLWLLWSMRGRLRLGPGVVIVALFCAPLLFYAYLPLRSLSRPALTFWGDLSTMEAMVGHMTGRLYNSHMFALPFARAAQRAEALSLLIVVSFLLSTVWLVIGAAGLVLRQRGFAVALLSAALMNLLLNLTYDVGDWLWFFFPLYIACAIWIGVGADVMLRCVARRASPASARLARALVGMVMLAAPLAQAAAACDRASFQGNRRALRDAEATLAASARGSTIYVRSDELLFSIWYVQYVLRRFADRTVISTGKLPPADHGRDPLLAALAAEADRARTYVAFGTVEVKAPLHCVSRGRLVEITTREAQARRAAAASTTQPKLSVQSEVKRDLLLPLTVSWQSQRSHSILEVAFLSSALSGEPPVGDFPEQLRLGDNRAANPQVGGWRQAITLHPTGVGEWCEEQISIPVPGAALPGRYLIYQRWQGRESPQWQRAGDVEVYDL